MRAFLRRDSCALFVLPLLTVVQITVHEKDGLRVVFAFEVDKSPKTVLTRFFGRH